MPEYTLLALASVALVVGAELCWLSTGIFRELQYWIAMVIVAFFEVLTDGWLTKLSAPIVRYRSGAISGLRVPFDIPVEDFLFGFSLVTSAILLWSRADRGVTRGRLPGSERRARSNRIVRRAPEPGP